MIEIKSLNKKFGKNEVLKNINLNLMDSRISIIAGPNGSGKTTLIKSLIGLVSIEKGEIFINGKNIKNSDKYRELIGYMPQIGRYPDNQTIKGVLDMILQLRAKNESSEMDRLIETFELQEHLNKRMSVLSGGTRQKVSAVIALMFNPDILILDEPTSGLDPLSAFKLKQLILNEKEKGKTIIIISHIMNEVEELADDMIFILDGEIKFKETVKDLLSRSGEINLERAISNLLLESKKK